MVYAGFWRRVGAFLIDWLVVGIASAIGDGVIAGCLFLIAKSGSVSGKVGDTASDIVGQSAIALFIIVPTVISWLYFAKLESSPRQATIGKEALNLRVTDLNGERITFMRATARYFAKVVSVVPVYLGFVMIGFTQKKQGLHDMIAGCLVISNPVTVQVRQGAPTPMTT